jgi:hypothetical protein
MNKVLTSRDIKSQFPILSCNAAVFKLGGQAFSAKSAAFESMNEVEKFVDENAGTIVIFDQPNLFTPDLPMRDSDRFILRYAVLPNFHGLISRLYQSLDGVAITAELKKDLDAYFGK